MDPNNLSDADYAAWVAGDNSVLDGADTNASGTGHSNDWAGPLGALIGGTGNIIAANNQAQLAQQNAANQLALQKLALTHPQSKPLSSTALLAIAGVILLVLGFFAFGRGK